MNLNVFTFVVFFYYFLRDFYIFFVAEQPLGLNIGSRNHVKKTQEKSYNTNIVRSTKNIHNVKVVTPAADLVPGVAQMLKCQMLKAGLNGLTRKN